ncbi:hypothetical protein REPUB_Repub01dG0269400 [Reevesia pubescens]
MVFISSDMDQASFEEYYLEMPWLALHFGDARKPLLSCKFNVRGIPMLITIGPTGKTVTKETMNLIMTHGSDAYLFTEKHLKEIEAQYEEMANEEEYKETKADEKKKDDKETKADENEEKNPKKG